MDCPKCGEQCGRESVDNGVAIIHGPWGCYNCRWSEDERYDLSNGKSPIDEEYGGVIDQFGGYTPNPEFKKEAPTEVKKMDDFLDFELKEAP